MDHMPCDVCHVIMPKGDLFPDGPNIDEDDFIWVITSCATCNTRVPTPKKPRLQN
jgi:heterodisulfide reductase subunit C